MNQLAVPDARPPATYVAYARSPMMIYWELTRSCDLACRHCRAEAVAWRHPRELTTEEGFRLLEQLSRFIEPDAPPAGRPAPGGRPHLVLTGGDPLKRPDVYDLAARGIELGLQVSITPAGTPLLTRAALARLREVGVHTVALSLDGSTPARHDRIRQVAGSFARTVEAARWAREAGFSLQINSLVCDETADDLPAVHRVVHELDADRWSVFFLVTVGRGQVLRQVTPEQCEAILEWLHDLTVESPRPVIKTTEAHHFRRIALQRQRAAHNGYASPSGGPPADRSLRGGPSPEATAAIRRGFGIRDGAGIMFVSHTGDVYPSGFLPVTAGNVREQHPVTIYRDAPLFLQLRDSDQLKGKCGACEFRTVCGGARSRAWAATGDVMAEDPLCVYRPSAHGPSRSGMVGAVQARRDQGVA